MKHLVSLKMNTSNNTTVEPDYPVDSVIFDDSEFCSSCGCIINTTRPELPTHCVACGYPIDASAIIGKVKTYVHVFNPWNHYLGSKKAKRASAAKSAEEYGGPMDESRECSKCGHRGMYYTTMQLRSVDEGQTIFYLCAKTDCKNREVENS